MFFSDLELRLLVSGNSSPNMQVLTPVLACEIPNPGASSLIADRVLGKVLKKPSFLVQCFSTYVS